MDASTEQQPAPSRPLRLLLVNPNVLAKNAHMHLGLVTIATYLRAHSRHEVQIVDFTATWAGAWKRRLRDDLAAFRPDVVGMYLSTPYFPFAGEVAAYVKQRADVPIVGGGHHATLAPEEVLSDPHFDWLVEGEGERAVVRLLDTLAEGGPLSGVPGLWYREAGGVRSVPKAPLLGVDEIPTLDWSLIGDEILRTNFHVWGILPAMASRGCPAGCSFCSITEIQKRYPGQPFLRYRDPERVVREIEADFARYRPLGMRTVQFVDLNFLMNADWLRRFTDAYRAAGLNRTLPWSAFSRIDHVTSAVIECLKDSGCVELRVGIEAANPWMRNVVYRKRLAQDVLEAGLRRIKDAGITVTGYFMVGGPGERPEWLLESLDFAWRQGVDFPFFFQYQPLAGSEVLERAPSLGSFLREDAMHRAAGFMRGVTMRHRHIAAWQLTSFVVFTHGLFTARRIGDQVRRTGPAWLAQMARYVPRTLRMGFPPHLALAYFILYAEDHLTEPYRAPLREERSPAWKALMAAARLVLPPSGAGAPGAADECVGGGLGRLAKRPQPSSIRQETARWDAVHSSDFERRRRRSQMRRKLRKLGVDREPRTARVLDLACGRGEMLEALHEMGFRDLGGVDLAIDPTLAADGRFACREASALDTRLEAGAYDVVTCLHALHHFSTASHVARLLSEAMRLLRPGGRLYLLDFHVSPLLSAVLWTLRRHRAWPLCRTLANQSAMVREEWPFLRGYLAQWEEIRQRLRDGGFEVVARRRTAFYFYLALRKPRDPTDPPVAPGARRPRQPPVCAC